MATQKTTATNLKQLSKALYEVFNDLRMGAIKAKDAKELVNGAGKIISTAKVRMDYKNRADKSWKIDDLED